MCQGLSFPVQTSQSAPLGPDGGVLLAGLGRVIKFA
jgi:hypothetical protein